MENRDSGSPAPEPRHLTSIKKDELGDFAGWRVRERRVGIWKGMFEEQKKEKDLVTAKPQTILVHPSTEGSRYETIADRYKEVSGRQVRPVRASGTRDGGFSYFLLEPMTVDELEAIREAASNTSTDPGLILSPNELQEILDIELQPRG